MAEISDSSGKRSSSTSAAGGRKLKVVSSSSASKPSTPYSDAVFGFIWTAFGVYVIYRLFWWAYKIRLQAIEEYGVVIHEFDPYFNYRATEYLLYNGAKKFFSWFDYMVWYPLGRPVGSTIYPGMQFIAVWINRYVLQDWSINDVCCYIPAWFGSVASGIVGLIAYECALPQNSHMNLYTLVMDIVKGRITNPDHTTRHDRKLLPGGLLYSPALECAVCAMGMMAIVPAHIMRSVGGGFDNESVAVTAMNLTFYFWVRSLRNADPYSWIFGALAGLAYFYMVASWGGYIFVLNMVGVHAAALVLMGRFQTKIYLSYSLFYVIGTALAVQVPVVGWAPLKSLEQLGPCAVFLGYQLLQFCEVLRRRHNLSRRDAWKLRVQVSAAALVIGIFGTWCLAPSGYFGPLSSRVRGLFVPHTKTGNPLVDSVAEHQAASSQAYFQYLHYVCLFAPLGYAMVFFYLSDASSFLLAWGTAAYFFSHKMVRLILLTAPIGSTLAGIAAGRLLAWSIRTLWDATAGLEDEEAGEKKKKKKKKSNEEEEEDAAAESSNNNYSGKSRNGKSNGKEKKQKKSKRSHAQTGTSVSKPSSKSSFDGFVALQDGIDKALKSQEGIMVKRSCAVMVILALYIFGSAFKDYCWRLSKDLSHPSIIQRGRTRDGRVVTIDDYREAYWWIRDNTPKDARIMAWWDYGYQIAGIANRTTIADGNTWNHEHIALLGKALTTNLDEGYSIARHLADYVLLWTGGGGDDLAKSPHLARIANSVYRDHCPNDPTCRAFGFVDRRGTPSAMMANSFLYTLHSHQLKPGVEAPADMFKEEFRSKFGKVRIFKILKVDQESKEWVANPENRKCDVPGSWFCPGQYPPGLSEILSKKKDFAQLEDFNKKKGDEQYQKEYFENLNNPNAAKERALKEEAYRSQKARKEKPVKSKSFRVNPDGTTTQVDAEAEALKRKKQEAYKTFENTDDTTYMWSLINDGKVNTLRQWLDNEPDKAFLRSEDGRGPMWWAFEANNQEVVKLLMEKGVPHGDADLEGKKPVDLLKS